MHIRTCFIFLAAKHVNTILSHFPGSNTCTYVPVSFTCLSHFPGRNTCTYVPVSFSWQQYMYIHACLIFLAAIHVYTYLFHCPGSNTCKYYPVSFSWQQYMYLFSYVSFSWPVPIMFSWQQYMYMYLRACLIFLAAIHVHTCLSHFPGKYMYIRFIFLAAIHVHTCLSHFPGSNTCIYVHVSLSWQQYM